MKCRKQTSSQKAYGSVVSNRIGTKFGRIVSQENTHRLTESDFRREVIYLQDGGYGVISRRKVLPSVECKCIYLFAAAAGCLQYRLQFLIHSPLDLLACSSLIFCFEAGT